MLNQNTTFEKVLKQLHSFRKELGWPGLAPADLAKSIALEALEHWTP